ncbi:acetyltransferase [Dyella flagellata]|uniref:Shikimate 5-dehydrogenase n=1 Tax=Dyella flagellata TaxID=1867833 RepID=A0ABQ5XBC2_9GAMM|nr:acetyltransferase [Dyella flagellata]GLQ88539.1 shikimate 5-dehydrogenase [Dyella flagellata]
MPLLYDTKISSVVIAGAGGFALEMFDYLNNEAMLGAPRVAGFIDDTPGGRPPTGVDAPHLGPISNFRPEPGQVVVVAIGSVKGRQAVTQMLWGNGIVIPAYIHSTAIISPAAKIEHGSIVCPMSIVNRNAALGIGSLLNVHGSIGHGARTGEFCVLSPYAALNGDATVGNRCFLGTRATIYPKISVEDDCVIDSHTGVRSNTPAGHIVSSRGTYQVSALRGAAKPAA